jgi:hypothetical protein
MFGVPGSWDRSGSGGLPHAHRSLTVLDVAAGDEYVDMLSRGTGAGTWARG